MSSRCLGSPVSCSRSRSRLGALLLLVLGAGCSDDAMGPSQFIDDYLDTYCSYLMRCCDVAERSYTTKVACENDRRPYLEAMLAFRDADKSYASFLSGEAQSCLDQLGQSDCVQATEAASCLETVTRGEHESGEDCTYSAECSSYYCIQDQKGVLGYCAGSSGGACSGDDRACNEGSYCEELQCVPKKDAGDICHRPEQCISGICTPQKLCAAASPPLCDGE